MLLPIKHENMAARRWPVVTLALIAINTVVFLFTLAVASDESPQLGEVKSHILILAALHPELKMQPPSQHVVDGFKEHHPDQWKQVQNPYRDIINAYDAKIKMMEDTSKLQDEMDSLNTQLVSLSKTSSVDEYAFVPANPTAISYLTANFLHGGWMHLIGNMWFLWLAGFVLEDAWGRWLYSAFYLIAGAAALQFYAWTNPGSVIPTVGASGAVAALMGAFLVRFPKMKIEMAWIWWFSFAKLLRTGNPFRMTQFKASAYWLLPLWLGSEIIYGALLGSSSGVAHWAHVGGFLFGAVAALTIQHSGLEHKANKAIEEKLAWTNDAELEQASDMMEHGQLGEALVLLTNYVAMKPNSLDAWNLLRQIHTRQNNTKEYLDATVKTCSLHLKAHEVEAAFQDYAEFIDSGGGKLPAANWLELCKGAEELQEFERALSEYEQLAQAYPADRQALTAQLSAARLCLKRLNRPQDALALYQKAAVSPIPHLDWEQHIQAGIKEAKAAMSSGNAIAAGAQ
ncbi:MAG TPA: rhomboid family intramembrane serine protease [Candidatus Binatus sp.]|jgi:membrane associated rhomboid family serine protease|nr:rhomboid family intramembrane serine protease [Candidatus Binatus sp.]